MKYFAQVAQLSKRNPAQIEASWFPNSLQMRWLTLGVTAVEWSVSDGSVAHMCLLALLSLWSSRKGLARFQFVKLLSICPTCAAFPDAPALFGIQASCMGNGSSSQQTLSFFPSRLPLPKDTWDEICQLTRQGSFPWQHLEIRTRYLQGASG